MTRRNSGLAILRAVQAVVAVAVVTRNPGLASIAFSPKKSFAETSRIVASLPEADATEIFTRPFWRKKTQSAGSP
jgi:hypothetical protein